MAYNVRNSLFPPLTLFILSNVCHLKYLPSATTAAPIITYGEGTNDDVHLVHSFARLFVSCTLVAAGVHCTSTTLREVYTRRVVGGGGHFRWTLEDSREAQADRQTDKWEVLCVALNTHICEHYIFVLSTWLHQQKLFVILFFTSLCLWEQILSLSGARFIHCTVVLSKVVFMCVCWWSWFFPSHFFLLLPILGRPRFSSTVQSQWLFVLAADLHFPLFSPPPSQLKHHRQMRASFLNCSRLLLCTFFLGWIYQQTSFSGKRH